MELEHFTTGAVRGTDLKHERYDLIDSVGLRRLAETYAEGAIKYAPNLWRLGIPASNLLNHAVKHLVQYMSGDCTEDHLAHATWNLFALMNFEEQRTDMIDLEARFNASGFVKEHLKWWDSQPVAEPQPAPPIDEPPDSYENHF